jgi:hypothetical protein
MTRASILQQFDRLNVWARGDQRAPHKPLLVLYALGRWSRGDTGDIPFSEVDRDLTGLLKEFGPPRQSYHPEYPFWRLQNDGVWQVHAAGALKPRKGNTDPPRASYWPATPAGASRRTSRPPSGPGPPLPPRSPPACWRTTSPSPSTPTSSRRSASPSVSPPPPRRGATRSSANGC